MKKSEICKLLSEALESKPTEWDEDHYHSPTGFWYCENLISTIYPKSIENPDGFEWQPVNYFESESASALLLEAMPEVQLVRLDLGWNCTIRYIGSYISRFNRLRKTAIVLAACSWKGIKVDSVEDG